MLYDDTEKRIIKNKNEYYYVLEALKENSEDEVALEKKNMLEEELMNLEDKKDKIISDIYEYNDYAIAYEDICEEISNFEKENPELNLDEDYTLKSNNRASVNDVAYYSKLKTNLLKYKEMLLKKEENYNKIMEIITSSISLDDIADKLKGYNSSYAPVPAGQWDTWTNPKYEGEGYESGMLGSFEGPQGKETGYDSRKGDEKTNYRDPDRSLLKFLSEVVDSEGNILYPMESFKKGGEFYYHIFGVNDDGSVNWNLVDNPRFGLKMLGNYLIVGSDQSLKRERGSKVMTSLGPAIVFDYGTIPDLENDPAHIDISMDEVLFWLKDFSHNSDRQIETLAGIYDWCTPEDYDGVIDENYEHMERMYVNNLNVNFNANCVCIFDRDDFENITSYDSQEEFVYTFKL